MLTKNNGFTLPLKLNFPEANKFVFSFMTLFFALLIIYSNSFQGEWHFDDYANIVNNPHIQMKSFSWEEVKTCIYGLEQARPSRPLSYLSFALNHHVHGLDVFGYHVVNFGIHYLTSLFLFLFIYNLLKLPRLRDSYENIAYPVALMATFLWATHPVFVTSVTYIVQRMASMAGMFYILSMYLYLKARTSKHTGPSIIFFVCCALSGLAAVLSKENAVMLPVSLLLLDLLLITGIHKESLKNIVKIIIIPFVIILLFGLIYTGGFSVAFGGFDMRDFTMIERLMTQPRVILFYLSLLFYPVLSRLTLLYDVEVSRSLLAPWTTIPSVFFIILAIAFAFWMARRRPLISFCILFYFLNHFIEGSFFSLELIYEHRNYIPAMLLFILPAHFLIYVLDFFSYKKTLQITVCFAIVVLLVGLGDITYRRNAIVSDDFKLWFDNIEKYPNLSRPHANLGIEYIKYDQKEKGLAAYEKALSLDNFGNIYARALHKYNMGGFFFHERKYREAMTYFERSYAAMEQYISTPLHMAKIELINHHFADARLRIEGLIRKHPENRELLEFYSLILLKHNQLSDAESLARKIQKMKINNPYPRMVLAEINAQKGNFRSAIAHWKMYQNDLPLNPYANLALIELAARTGDIGLFEAELSRLNCFMGAKPMRLYLEEVFRDQNLLVYTPDLDQLMMLINKTRPR